MFVKNRFSAVRAELSAAHAKPIPRGATVGWTARAAAARAPPPLVLNKIPSDQSTDHAPAARREGYNEPQQRLLQDTPSLSHQETQYA